MELADSGYNYEKYDVTLEEQLPNFKETTNIIKKKHRLELICLRII